MKTKPASISGAIGGSTTAPEHVLALQFLDLGVELVVDVVDLLAVLLFSLFGIVVDPLLPLVGEVFTRLRMSGGSIVRVLLELLLESRLPR